MRTSRRTAKPRRQRRLATASRMRRIASVLVAASLATGASVTRADAAIPTSTETSLHVARPNFISCDGFGVTLEGDVTRTDTTFTDQSGTPTRTAIHIRFTGTLTNPQTGKSVLDNGSFQRTIDPSDRSVTVTGGFRVITAPGAGVLLHQTGRGILLNGEVVFGAGQNEFNDEEFDELCAYLAT